MFKKVLKLTLLFVLGILSLFAVSCAGTAGGGIDLEDTALSVMLPGNKALWDVSDVQVFTVTISSKSYKDTKTAPGGNTITFSNIPVGHYNIEAIGKNNNGDLTAKGSAEVDVVENVNSSVTVKLSRLDYYTVTFDLEGGTGNISEQKVTTGYTAKRPDNPTNSDPLYHFVGWTLVLKDNIADCVLYDFATPVNGDITLHAIWSRYPCVTFDYNYTGASPDLIPVTTGTVSSRPASRSGATFKGWSTSRTSYVPFDFSTTVTSDITLFAIWEFSVSFNLNYTGAPTGTIPDQTVADGSCATLPTAPTRTGYSFSFWSTSNSTGATNDETTPITGNTTLYAIWTPIKYYVRFYDGSDVHATKQLDYDDVPKNITVTKPTKTGFVFKGWTSTQPVEGTESTIDLPYVEGSNTIVISTNLKDTSGSYKDYWAVWEGNPFTAYFFEITNMDRTTVSGSTAYEKITYTLVSSTPATYTLRASSSKGEYYLKKDSTWSTVTGEVTYYESTGDNRFIFTITESGTEKKYICSKTAVLSNTEYKARVFDRTPTVYLNN